MAKYSKKPVVIDAIKWDGENIEEFVSFCPTGILDWGTGGINIPTLEGTMQASIGDYIIKGIKGEFYPCKPDIFEATYDLEGEKSNPQWDEAIKNARFMLEEYKKIPSGAFGAIAIALAISRYENGERTNELLEELESIQ